MFFWVSLAVVLIAAGMVIAWGARGRDDRVQKPGTTYLK